LSHYNFTYFYKRSLTATEHLREEGKEGGMWGSEEAGREGKKEIYTWLGVLREPLWVTLSEMPTSLHMAAQSLDVIVRGTQSLHGKWDKIFAAHTAKR
jgi:hypothetical protein